MKKLFSALLITLFTFSGFIFPGTEASATAPPEADGVVIDNVGIFSEEDVEHLNARADTMLDDYDIALAVEIVDTFDGEDPRDAATNRANVLGVGDAEKNNGMFYYIAIDDRSYFVATGDGLTEVSESRLQVILDDTLKKAFQSENYATGIYDTTVEYTEILSGEYCIPFSSWCFSEKEATHYGMLFGFTIGICLVFGIITRIIAARDKRVQKQRRAEAEEVRQRHDQLLATTNNILNRLSKAEYDKLIQAPDYLHRKELMEQHGFPTGTEGYSATADRLFFKDITGLREYNKHDSVYNVKKEEGLKDRLVAEAEPFIEHRAKTMYDLLSIEDRMRMAENSISSLEARDIVQKYGNDEYFKYENSEIGMDHYDRLIMDRIMQQWRKQIDRDAEVAKIRQRRIDSYNSSGSSGGSSTFGGGSFSGGGAGGRW